MQKKSYYFGAVLAVVLAVSNVFFVSGPAFATAQEELPKAIIISAVQITGGVGKTSQDFVELYNPNSEPLNLNGYRLVKRSSTGTADSSIKSWSSDSYIPAYGFYLWANSSYGDIPVLPDTITSSTLADDNGIALRFGANDTGAIIDSLAWGATSNTFASSGLANPGAGESIARTSMSEPKLYAVQLSSPRNSSVVLAPTAEQVPTGDLPETDPAPQEPPAEEQPVEEPPAEEQPAQEQAPLEQPRTIYITELLPNPSGADAGKEEIELFNYGSQIVDLSNWVLDDVSAEQPLSSNNYAIMGLNLEPGQYASIIIPAGKFTLNNSSGDTVTLFDSNGEAVDTVIYTQSAPSGKSYSKIGDLWNWAIPTQGSQNVPDLAPEEEIEEEEQQLLPSIQGLVISEIYAAPLKGEQEFVELYNSSDSEIDMTGGIIMVGNSSAGLPQIMVPAKSYYLLRRETLTLALANSGKKVSLLQKQDGVAAQNSAVVFTVEYPKSITGQSYAKFEDNFLWTSKVTPGSVNVLEQPQQKPAANLESDKKPVVKKSTSPKAPVKTTVKTSSTKAAAKPAEKTNSKPAATAKKTTESVKNEQKSEDENKPKSKGLAGVVAIAVASLGAGGLAVYRFGMGGGMPF
ncbi:lamin tail domain-containing protein [bacterium]|nr:MAG: lamin tail domain-containing protein [bacterium]